MHFLTEEGLLSAAKATGGAMALRRHALGGRGDLAVPPGARVCDVLGQLFALLPGLEEQVIDPETGELLPHVNIMLRGRLIRDLQGLATPVSERDEMAIFPPIAGGSRNTRGLPMLGGLPICGGDVLRCAGDHLFWRGTSVRT